MPVSFLSPFSPEASVEANKTKQLLLKDSISLMQNSPHPQAVSDLLSWGLSPCALRCILKEFIFISFSLLMVPFNFTCGDWIFPLVILNFLARDGPITSWQIDGETLETVIDFIFLGSKITADDYCSHEIKTKTKTKTQKPLVPWKKSDDRPRQHIKKQRHYFAHKCP